MTTWLIHRNKIEKLGLIEKDPNKCVKGEIIYVLIETAWDEIEQTRYGIMEAKVLKVDSEYGWLRCETTKQYLDISRCDWSTKADVYLFRNEKVYTYPGKPQIIEERKYSYTKPMSSKEESDFNEKMNRIGSDGRTQWQFLNGTDRWDRNKI